MNSSKVCRHPRSPNNIRYPKASFESESLQKRFPSAPINKKASTYAATMYISSTLIPTPSLVFSPFLPSMFSHSKLQKHLSGSIQGCSSAQMRYQGDCCPSACQSSLSYAIWASEWVKYDSLCTRFHNTYIGITIYFMVSLVILYASWDHLWRNFWISFFLLYFHITVLEIVSMSNKYTPDENTFSAQKKWF